MKGPTTMSIKPILASWKPNAIAVGVAFLALNFIASIWSGCSLERPGMQLPLAFPVCFKTAPELLSEESLHNRTDDTLLTQAVQSSRSVASERIDSLLPTKSFSRLGKHYWLGQRSPQPQSVTASLCGLDREELQRYLDVPRNESGSKNRWLSDRFWYAFSDLGWQRALEKKGPPVCLVGHIIDQIPCPGSECLVSVYIRPRTPDLKQLKQVFEEKQYESIVGDIGPRRDFILDERAGTGLASVVFASTFPNALIVAVEPDVRNYEMLLLNTACYPNVVALHAELDRGLKESETAYPEPRNEDADVGATCLSSLGNPKPEITNPEGRDAELARISPDPISLPKPKATNPETRKLEDSQPADVTPHKATKPGNANPEPREKSAELVGTCPTTSRGNFKPSSPRMSETYGCDMPGGQGVPGEFRVNGKKTGINRLSIDMVLDLLALPRFDYVTREEKATSPTGDRLEDLPSRSLLNSVEPLSVDIPEGKKEEGSKAIPEALKSDFRDYWRGTEDHLSVSEVL